MKTVMKKLLSLMLVAVLLVSAVPFQASAMTAKDDGTIEVPVTVYVDGENKAGYNKTLPVSADVALTENVIMNLLQNSANRKLEKLTSSATPDTDITGKTLTYNWLLEQESYSLTAYIVTESAEHTHSYVVTTKVDATCTKSGYIISECACGTQTSETIPAAGHDWGDWSETKAATTTEDGSEQRTCKTCGETETQTIPATGEYTINLIADGATVQTLTLKKGDKVPALQTPSAKKGYTFKGYWSGANGTGTQLVAGYTWNGGETTYYAYYQENLEDDGVSVLSIRMKVYVGSVQKNDVLLYKVTLDDSTKILSYLMNNEGTIEKAAFNAIDSSKYEWIDRVYYDNDSSAELTSQATLADGDKSVFIKVHAKESTQTNVQLYIHSYNSTSKTYTTLKVVDVEGYTKGNTITLAAMKTIANKYYTFTAIKGLYSADAWAQLLNGEKPTAASSLTVSDTGTVKYHVILTGASAASSSETADSTNPKTGDMIIVPVIFMLASAAAVALVYMGTKKRIVK